MRKEVIIGERVREVMQAQNMDAAEFARLLSYDPANVYNIFRRKKIDVELLARISKVLRHNFVEEICVQCGFNARLFPPKIAIVLKISDLSTKKFNNFVDALKELGDCNMRVVEQ